MEQKITAAARVVEILHGGQASKRTPAVDQLQIKSELTNPFRRRLIALSDDKVLSGSDVPTSNFAIKADMHDASGAQYRSKNAPTCHWVIEVVQYADTLDEIEGLADGFQPQNVGLYVFDVRDAQLSRFSLRVGEARCTKVDRQNRRRWKSLRRLDRLLCG